MSTFPDPDKKPARGRAVAALFVVAGILAAAGILALIYGGAS